MDDSCAVCADALEWVAYGPCGHREVCSTCVVRLRFVFNDRRCCICKTDNPLIFVTKALGEYTRVVADFSVFPAGATEGQVGQYWYHEDTQAFFDDVDQYKMIKAMCRLSCNVCDKNAEEQGIEIAKRRDKFKSIEQLKGHLFHQHKLFMCSLCLEGRKVFICEQKLYNRSQLNQHIRTGDSEVDGSESDRGGFMGHPMCEFCKNPFYGDNELYLHMSTEHYTCHICQRQHPGQYDYYKNYDDLEMHFRNEHYLCEDEACLAKKFVVFQSEAEMKRHNTIEHGGHMSRSKRNAALQIPTSFRYRETEQEQRRGRGRRFHREPSDNQLSMALQASLETALSENRSRDSSAAHSFTERAETSRDIFRGSTESLNISSGPEVSSALGIQSSRVSPILEESSFPPLADRDVPEHSSRYSQAISQYSRGSTRLGAEYFPPLPGATNKQKVVPGSKGSSGNKLAARLSKHSNASSSINLASSRPLERKEIQPPTPQVKVNPHQGLTIDSSSSFPRLTTAPTRENGFALPSHAKSAWNLTKSNKLKHSVSAPSLGVGPVANQASSSMGAAVNQKVNQASSSTGAAVNQKANQASSSMGAAVNQKTHLSNNQPQPNMGNIQAANKSLVERIRISLGMDEDRYSAFKSISSEYRQGLIDTWEYLSYVEQFGLSHLVLELAQLCPDALKQKELIDAYNANLSKRSQEYAGNIGQSLKENKNKKGKGKALEQADIISAKDALADSILDTVRKLQLNNKPQEGEVEVLSKDGYRSAKDKILLSAGTSSNDMNSDRGANRDIQSLSDTSTTSSNGGGSKQRRKTSKFHRNRLGDGSTSALDINQRDASPKHADRESTDRPSDGLSVRGAWRNGGGHRLFTK